MGDIDGFILAAGLGTRMGPLSRCLPKPAWTLEGVPLLQLAAHSLIQAGRTRLACNAHHLPEAIQSAAGGLLEVCLEPELMGSAGGLLHIRGLAADPLPVWNADAIADVPWSAFLEAHRQRGAQLSWLLVPHPGGPWNPVWLDDQGRVLPPGRTGQGPYHFTGASLWGAEALALLPEGPSDTKRDVLPRLTHHAGIVVAPFPWVEVGTPDQLITAAAQRAPQDEGRIPGSYLAPGASARGPLRHCILGPGVQLPDPDGDADAFWCENEGRLERWPL